MDNQTKLVTKDGVTGKIEAFQSPERGNQVVVRLDNQQLLVPAEMLVRQEDSSYYLPLSLAELKRQFVDQGDNNIVIPVIEEELHLEKRIVETGKVRLHKQVHEKEEAVELPLLEEEVEVKRVPVNRKVVEPAPIRYEGETMIVPVHQEVLVVQKQLVLKEEIHISSKRVRSQHEKRVTVREEEISIESIDVQGSSVERPS